MPRVVSFLVNGSSVELVDNGDSLLDVLRDELGLIGTKDGCSPQGQCGCCTVLVDGEPRVACVTPARRVAGRAVVTIEGLAPEDRAQWGSALCRTGGSQCGFCTPGIIMRLESLTLRHEAATAESVRQALLAHLCRCTGWQTIIEAWEDREVTRHHARGMPEPDSGRDLEAAAERARLEGHAVQRIAPEVGLGHGGFAADTAPAGSLRAVVDESGRWFVAETLAEARRRAGKTQGRRTTADHVWPLQVPDGDWAATLRTTWVEPAYLETDASWCEPGGEPSSPLANGGGFGAKQRKGAPWSPVMEAARLLADEHGRAVLAVASREDTVRWGPKRPPVAGGVRADGTGVLRICSTPGVAATIALVAPGLVVEEVDVVGPATSNDLRGAGWVEALVLLSGASDEVGIVTAPNGARAWAEVTPTSIRVGVRCGRTLDHAVLRSYCVGASHMAYSWVTSEALSVDGDGEVHDLTIRSFGVLRAVDTPEIEIVVEPDDGPPINGSDAVFAAVAAATWRASGRPTEWPVGLLP